MSSSSDPRFLAILRVRAEHFGDQEMGEAKVLARFLEGECSLPRRKAEAIVRGEDVDLTEEEIACLSRVFRLHQGLLSCVLFPPTSEVLHFALRDLMGEESNFNIRRCAYCRELFERVQECHASDERDDLLDLCYDILDHMLLPVSDQEGDIEDLGDEDMPFLSSLFPVLMQLDDMARRRVLAYAYQELAQSTDGVSANVLAAYARLRAEHFSPLVRQVFDVLADAPEGTMSIEKLARELNLPDARSLRAVPQATQDALSALARATGHVLDDTPLQVSESPAKFCLSESACQAWHALALADKSF
jgi:hypothetical protein